MTPIHAHDVVPLPVPAALMLPGMPSGCDRLALDQPRIMGVLNVTPDSFSDGGRLTSVDAAVAAGLAMARAGVDVIDIGGESTRPGAERVAVAEQARRVVPVIKRLRQALNDEAPAVTISVDTTRAEVARAAVDAGASILNDVSAGRDDVELFTVAAQARTPLILMHMQGQPTTMQDAPTYEDVVAEVSAFLEERACAAQAAGVPGSQIVVDPGIGFGKTLDHNLALLAGMGALRQAGRAVLIGASRKRMIGMIDPLGGGNTDARLGGTIALTTWAVLHGVSLVRVHDVVENRQAALVAAALAGIRR